MLGQHKGRVPQPSITKEKAKEGRKEGSKKERKKEGRKEGKKEGRVEIRTTYRVTASTREALAVTAMMLVQFSFVGEACSAQVTTEWVGAAVEARQVHVQLVLHRKCLHAELTGYLSRGCFQCGKGHFCLCIHVIIIVIARGHALLCVK